MSRDNGDFKLLARARRTARPDLGRLSVVELGQRLDELGCHRRELMGAARATYGPWFMRVIHAEMTEYRRQIADVQAEVARRVKGNGHVV